VAPTTSSHGDIERTFHAARSSHDRAVLEGFHAVKHALRFGAEIEIIVTRDLRGLMSLASSLAPDVEDVLRKSSREVSADVFESLTPSPPDTAVIAIARRPSVRAEGLLLNEGRAAPAVLLDHPAHRGNIGAVIRVAAAAGASAVITTGPLDAWDPAVLRGSAGLHFAIAVARADRLEVRRGPLIALDPNGKPLGSDVIPANALLAFGSERRGLSREVLSMADETIAIPMQPRVSSLNLATAVAVVLYTWRLQR
jgi:RNA methyltransferase, TrmH family